MLTSFKRILKFGWQGFWRNKTLSLQVIFIMGVVVFAISLIFLFEQVGNFLIAQSVNLAQSAPVINLYAQYAKTLATFDAEEIQSVDRKTYQHLIVR